MKRPTHGTLAAYAALFISLGGTGYAATQLAPNSVGSAQIRNGSVQSRDLSRSVFSRKNAKLASTITDVVTDPTSGIDVHVTATDGKDGAPGPMGPVGPQGDPSKAPGPQGVQGVAGPRGEALGYVHVSANGTIDPAHSSSNVAVLKPSGYSGLYCVNITDGTVRNVVASLENDGLVATAAWVRPAVKDDPCDVASYPFEVSTVNGTAGVDHGFFATIN